ncbi:MAG: glycyl-radical enzyme activating protein [candidate division KSB1 bacterium]|nr:glycyl-radical enzyme activating protein [candidate division KSB1 bacterium]
MKTGMIFDIQKFALHDGPGIRTAVFLKGCPLKCVWCCNPESRSPEPQLGYDAGACRQCFSCTPVCEPGALRRDGDHLKVRHEQCTACGACIRECPQGALNLYGYRAHVDDIMHSVLRDRDYYNNSGGGITLSGGDPLYQFEFTRELLNAAGREGLNTCLETAGYAPRDQIAALLPLVDHFLYDYKLTDNHLHDRYTGVSNQIILENLSFLAANNADLVLRCIMVPGINDTDDHFQAIADLSQTHTCIRKVEIMPYHDYGRKKYHMTGSHYPLDAQSVSKAKAREWVNQLQSLGCKNVNIG